MATITADKVVNQNMFAKKNVSSYAYPGSKTVKKTYLAGALIGRVYGWVMNPEKTKVFWMFNENSPEYIEHDANALTVPALPDIIKQIETEQQNAEYESKGALRYYVDKYAPYIIGGIALSFVLPQLLKTKKVGAMTDNTKKLLLVGGAVALFAFTVKKKNKGSIEIGELDKGEFLPDSNPVSNTVSNPVSNTVSTESRQLITHVGLFPVTYNNQIAGAKKLPKTN